MPRPDDISSKTAFLKIITGTTDDLRGDLDIITNALGRTGRMGKSLGNFIHENLDPYQYPREELAVKAFDDAVHGNHVRLARLKFTLLGNMEDETKGTPEQIEEEIAWHWEKGRLKPTDLGIGKIQFARGQPKGRRMAAFININRPTIETITRPMTKDAHARIAKKKSESLANEGPQRSVVSIRELTPYKLN